jgi:hypothetical protein
MRKQLIAVNVLVALNAVTAAVAADLPVKVPEAVVAPEQGIYVWLDGSYQHISLPQYSLGFKRIGAGFIDLGNFDSIKARADGGAGSAGIGYAVPNGVLSPVFGSNLRAEAIISYLDARGTQHGGTTLVNDSVESGIQLLNGNALTTLQTCVPCISTVTLSSRVTGWQGSGRIASDYALGYGSLTPSFGVFAGNTRNNQTFSQTVQTPPNSNNAVPLFSTYAANTSLKWTDYGARFGLEGRLPVHPWVTLALGGSVGWAQRQTDFVGNDVVNCGFLSIVCPNASTFGANASKTAFLANVEGSVIVGQGGGWKGRLFAGANFDDSVPGLSSNSYTGSVFAPTSVTPAGIVYSSQTSLYAGLGIAYRWFGATP